MGRPKAKRPVPKIVGEQKIDSVASKANVPLPTTVPSEPPAKSLPKFSIQPLSSEQIKELVSQKWEDAQRKKYAYEEKVFAAILDKVKENLFSGNFQALSDNEIVIYLNEVEGDSLTFNKLIPHLNQQLLDLRVRIIRGVFGFTDDVSVINVYIQIFG